MRSAPKNETEAERDAQASSTMDTAEVKEVEHSGVKLYSNADEIGHLVNPKWHWIRISLFLSSLSSFSKDALRVLRERFEDLQMERDDENNRRKWINSKVIYRTNSVHGGSPLWEMECADYGDEDGNEELEQDTGNEAAGLVLSSPLHFNIDRHRVHAVSEVISARARPGLSRTVQQGEAVSATTEYQERFVDRYLGIVTDRQAVVEAAQDDEAVVLPDLVDLERGIPLLELGNCVSAASHILTAYDVATVPWLRCVVSLTQQRFF
ncbi:predicted protein [Pyrenophora tritici-repentis Pt-1C-BFP]|uniref:Uncharacterized protein n=1 Tax=Pyrenophora tritici-repentis (strain Pt-1C-BFP) TaxID=426418 RepID=B2VX76_PYRTR|nr:uncharacterized protein PTRG_03122 [Pyrenophora tritici-repentis Pt-1C-BFP]EDU45645.1 predicted protein [Pyrenophora tritici-repentis Pt-1C-BFP]